MCLQEENVIYLSADDFHIQLLWNKTLIRRLAQSGKFEYVRHVIFDTSEYRLVPGSIAAPHVGQDGPEM